MKTCIPAPDGYQYGVRWHDGGISHGWNGRTQLDRAQEFIFLMRKTWPTCTVSKWALVRRQITPVLGPWEPIDIDPWRKPLTNSVVIVRPSGPGGGWTLRGHAVAIMCARQAWGKLRVALSKGEHN